MSIHIFRHQGLEVAVDRSRQVLHLELDTMASWREMRHAPTTTRREADGITVLEFDRGSGFEALLYPSIAALPDEGPFVSAAVLAQKAKAVDDGVVATLELILDEGAQGLRGRSALLSELQTRLVGEGETSQDDAALAEAIGLISAARSLSGDEDAAELKNWPPAPRLRRSRHLRDVRSKPESNVPLGVYSWSQRLAGFYRQAKLLQEPLAGPTAGHLARALRTDEEMRDSYRSHLGVLALTNPLVRADVLSAKPTAIEEGQESAGLFPASETAEGRRVKRLIGNTPVPPGFDLIGELIARVQDGRLRLSATEGSGWYDHVLDALEPLIVPDHSPEAVRLGLGDEYRADLRSLFRSLLGMTRESHIKQIEVPSAGGCPLVIKPHLSLEPLAEHYRRRADSFRFVRERLVDLLGEAVLVSRRRLTPEGETGAPLLDELIAMEQLYARAWGIAREELGLEVSGDPAERRWLMAATAAARRWIAGHRDDTDLKRDARMMVPLFKDAEREEYHVLALVGFEQRNFKASFVERPGVTLRDGMGRPFEHAFYWDDATYVLARPVTITCRTKRLLDRDEFRALCDGHGTASAIRTALEE